MLHTKANSARATGPMAKARLRNNLEGKFRSQSSELIGKEFQECDPQKKWGTPLLSQQLPPWGSPGEMIRRLVCITSGSRSLSTILELAATNQPSEIDGPMGKISH